MTDVLDFSKLTPKQQAAIQKYLMNVAAEADAAGTPEVDTTREPVVMVCGNALTPHAFLLEDITAINPMTGARNEPVVCPEPGCGARLGHAPVLYNGKAIASLEHHVGLRKGDAAILAKYAADKTESSADARHADEVSAASATYADAVSKADAERSASVGGSQ